MLVFVMQMETIKTVPWTRAKLCDLTQRSGRDQIKMTLNCIERIGCSDQVNFTPTAVPELDARIPQGPDPYPV
jgi:hypothetical protein